ncbi:MAG: beta-ketoacyl synthase [Pseudomonadota bacterium]
MARLPLIVSFGGYNAAGRSSFHQGYQRTVLDALSAQKQQETLLGLAVMMGYVNADGDAYKNPQGDCLSGAEVVQRYRVEIEQNTLIRRIGAQFFDVDRVPHHHSLSVNETNRESFTFTLSKRNLPKPLPSHWQVSELNERKVRITVTGEQTLHVKSHFASPIQAAGQLPTGFNPAELYQSRFHPRGLQLSVLAASDAINALGIDWETITQHVSPDQISCYASSIAGQLDYEGFGGMLQSRLKGGRVSSKQLPLGFNSMSADFVNAYVIGNLGTTSAVSGACATFLFNLRAAVSDIQLGHCRVAIVGTSEAVITPEVIEGFDAMGALATTEKLCKLDGTEATDLRRASRPFGENCGFVMGEGSQYIVLMDDELAIELGADVHGAVSNVFVHADGFKKSISAPGPGNYISMAKALASARSLLGSEAIMKRSFVQAHGSSTPQNRVTESELLDRVAKTFGIDNWPVVAVKAYLGHSLGPASGDQLVSSLGIFAQGILPGITTISGVADDVVKDHLSISNQHRQLEADMDVAFLNSKGFGGNNASASILAPKVAEKMLSNRHGAQIMNKYYAKREDTREQAKAYNQQYLRGNYQIIYKYGQNMLDENLISIEKESLSVPGYGQAIDLNQENLYKDMT